MRRFLVDLRTDRELTVRAAAALIGIDQRTLADAEHGARRVHLRVAQSIADFYGVSLGQLFPELLDG